ncbi:hypothetical protein G5I_00757 [Acromyrmex echinatior]|uniref:BED-type domain-containing protein n=1 Tax=Acromyrmex echinatior TaxID=103372 RepID=F4W5Q8_ACREC|nr:hypothetical protein G5I_00757 [Acromyrmex echinatior]
MLYALNYVFHGFSPYPDSFLKCQRFVNLAVYIIRAKNSLILTDILKVSASRMKNDFVHVAPSTGLTVCHSVTPIINDILDYCFSKLELSHTLGHSLNILGNYILLPLHLNVVHPGVLTEEQKTEHNIHWAWDYFTPTSDGGECNICSTSITSGIGAITNHLNIHRKTHKFFDPNEVIYEYTYMYGASTSASGSMIVKEYQGASIPIASNLTDDG